MTCVTVADNPQQPLGTRQAKHSQKEPTNMSCRTTKSGTIALRLARIYSGLSDGKTQKLFHALLREGNDLPDPTQGDLKWFHTRQKALLRHADITEGSRAQAERDLFRAQTEQPDGALFHACSLIEVRARQESVLNDITTAIDLEPPGSQKEQYELGEDGRPINVWYASYGSNMNKERFLTYIKGGEPEGSSTTHSGARNDTEPTGDIPIRFDGRMHFAYTSSRWGGGGVAFMDVDHAGHALGRAYKITSEQFDDIVAQENGRYITTQTTPTPINFKTVLTDGQDIISKNIYGNLLHIGDYQGAPVLTFTGTFTAQEATLEAAIFNSGGKADTYIASNSPNGNYLRMIAKGLNESFNMNEEQQADYLRGCAGAEDWTRREILAVLRAPEPTPTPRRYTTAATYTFPEPTRKPLYGVTTKPISIPRYNGIKACPICNDPRHTMHDCPRLTPTRPTKPVIAKGKEDITQLLKKFGMNDVTPSAEAQIMYNRWNITKEIYNPDTKEVTVTLTRFDGKTFTATTDNHGETYTYPKNDSAKTFKEDAESAFPNNPVAAEDFTYLLQQTHPLNDPLIPFNHETTITTNASNYRYTPTLLKEALSNIILDDAEPSPTAHILLSNWEFADDDADDNGWTTEIYHVGTDEFITIHHANTNTNETTYTASNPSTLALFHNDAKKAFPKEEHPTETFTEVIEELTNLTH